MSAQRSERQDQPSLDAALIYARDYIARCQRDGVPEVAPGENLLKICRSLVEAVAPPPESVTPTTAP